MNSPDPFGYDFETAHLEGARRRAALEAYAHAAHCGQAWWRSWLVAFMHPLLVFMLIMGLAGETAHFLWLYRERVAMIPCPFCAARLSVRVSRRGIGGVQHDHPVCHEWTEPTDAGPFFAYLHARIANPGRR